MKVTSLLLTLSLASILSITAFSTVTNDAYAQQPLFDYRCYNIDQIFLGNNGNDQIILKDQFFPNGATHTLEYSKEFCNPANKQFNQPTGTEPPGFLPHLRCWKIDDQGPVGIDVILEDQFFPLGREHTVMEALEFCSPDKTSHPSWFALSSAQGGRSVKTPCVFDAGVHSLMASLITTFLLNPEIATSASVN